MLQLRIATVLAFLAATAGCGGGGGSSVSTVPVPQWSQFRNNSARTGGFGGGILINEGALRFAAVDDTEPPSAIVASPAIGNDGTIYIGSTGGTLRAFDPETLEPVWTVRSCSACCPASAGSGCDESLGPLTSSPTLYRDVDGLVNIVIGDDGGRVYRFSVLESAAEPEPTCDTCFAPDLTDDFPATAVAGFSSSPTVTFNTITGSLAAILIGAEIRTTPAAAPTAGKLYAINEDGTTRWQYPARGEGAVGPISSSPALSLGRAVAVLDGDGVMHLLTRNGELRRRISIDGLYDATVGFLQPSIVSSASLVVGTAAGDIYAFNHDGTFRWATELDGRRFLNSLSIGTKLDPTPTSVATVTGTATPTPDPNEATPTPTPTAITDFSTVIGVSADGVVVFLDSKTGELIEDTTDRSWFNDDGVVLSSPSLSFDGLLTFGTDAGALFNVDTGSAEPPRFCLANTELICLTDEDCGDDDVCAASFWPVRIPSRCPSGAPCTSDEDCGDAPCTRAAIASSPAIDTSGVIYVGATDGYLYAVGATGTPARTASPTPTPTAPAANRAGSRGADAP